jgi:hypothetical protein
MAKASTIEDAVRARVLQAIEEIKDRNPLLTYADIMESLNEFQSVHSQMKSHLRYPTLKMLYQLHEVYQYRFDWLFLGTGTKRTLQPKSQSSGIELIKEGLAMLEKAKPIYTRKRQLQR